MPTKTFIFDLDGTLFETSAEILYDDNGDPDFREFSSHRLLLTESNPKLDMIALAIQVKKEGHKVFILTARGNAIAQAIKNLLLNYGVIADYVFCVGDRGLDIPTYKAEIIQEMCEELEGQMFFYDDDLDNLEEVAKLNLDNLKVYKV